jgi:hypothetical protein
LVEGVEPIQYLRFFVHRFSGKSIVFLLVLSREFSEMIHNHYFSIIHTPHSPSIPYAVRLGSVDFFAPYFQAATAARAAWFFCLTKPWETIRKCGKSTH